MNAAVHSEQLSVEHLLGIKELSTEDIELIFRTADGFKEVLNRPIKKVPSLRDITIANLFFESSTRTRVSFELAEKRLKEYAAGVKAKKLQLEEAEAVAEGRAADLAAKKNELEGIEAETAPQVAEYEVQADRVKAKIDERLLSAYGRIRSNVRNGLAVVTVKRDACGGCFNRIPPQRQVEIRQGKKLIVCEYCGRILVADPEEGME